MVRTTSTDRLKGYGKNAKSAKIQRIFKKQTMSNKAAVKRQFRQRERQRKHFTRPIQKFLEEKYPIIFTEYKELYSMLNERHPLVRDLTKTCTFKAWVRSVKQQQTPDVLSIAMNETLQSLGETSSEQSDVPEQNDVPKQNERSNDGHSFEGDKTEEAETTTTNNHDDTTAQGETNEATSVLVGMNDLINIMSNVEEQVDDVINELMREEAVRNILDQPTDEGIEIDPLDDIDIDIEPFDFDAEVEQYFW